MCGIMACQGQGNTVLETLMGMEKLEYRGYDSAGIAYVSGGAINVSKQAGCVADLMHKIQICKRATLCIGHTRWATHGGPSRRNAHPHSTRDNRLAIVHNGIIENCFDLKKELLSKGYKFLSDTDTEVLLYLIYDHFMNHGLDLYDATKLALSRVVGAYAFILIDRHDDRTMICGKKGSPLAIGVKKDKTTHYVASDICAFPKDINQVVYLEDNTLAKINNKIETFDLKKNKASDYVVKSIQKELTIVDKGKHKHFMQKEIHEQSISVVNAMAGRIDGYRMIFGGLSDHVEIFKRANHITIIACGTSYNAGLLGKYYIEEFTNKKVSVEYASEFRYRKISNIKHGDIVIGISQSGETADTIEALKIAKKQGCKIIGICNNVDSSISRLTDCGIYIKAGLEVGVASTKAFTNQVLCLLMMAMWIDQQQSDWITHADMRRYIVSDMKDITAHIITILSQAEDIRKIANKYKSYNKFLFIGRQYNYPVALEGALKMKELCYNYAEGYAAAELKHGPIALVDKKTVCIIINNDIKQKMKMNSTIEEIKSRGGKVINVDCDDEYLVNIDDSIIIPKVASCLSPVLSVIPLQLMAYYSAIARKKNVDRPRNLAKSVTVE